MRFATPERVKTPWYTFMNGIPEHLDYQECSMCAALERIAERYPQLTAYDFMGSHVSYAQAMADIRACARALRAASI